MGPKVKQTLYLVALLGSLVGIAYVGKKYILPRFKN